MACQKYANKVGIMHEIKGQQIGKAPSLPNYSYIDSAWGQVHNLCWQFMAVVSLLLRITAVQASLVEYVHGGPAQNARVSRCDERTRVHKCVNKLLFQSLESSPVLYPAMSPPLLFCRP